MQKLTLMVALISAIAGLTSTNAASYTTPAEERQNADLAERVLARLKLAHFVGKTFWIVPNPKAINRIEFYKEIPSDYSGAGQFHPTEVSKFVVEDFSVTGDSDYPSLDEHYLQVRFEDGMTGFLKVDLDSSTGFYHGGPRYDFEEYIYSENPANIDKRQAKQRAAAKSAAKARSARGGVRIGMTKSQVLLSSWGRPREINRTTTAGGVHEQWVYGGRNYLYFGNGILTGIQN